MAASFWEILQQRQASLTKSGRIVAQYLTENADKAQYISISTLARECGVAEATVFRFCRTLGFDGYHEMRIALAKANVTDAPRVGRPADNGDVTTAAMCDYAASRFAAAIHTTRSALSPEAVEKAAHLLHEAKQVFCFGLGGSMLLAGDICTRFNGVSTKFRTVGDSCLQQMAAGLMRPGDVVLFVSYAGESTTMLDILKTAKASGAGIVLMTHYPDSPGAALADIVLECAVREDPLETGSLPVKAAELYIAEMLLQCYRKQETN